MEKYEQSTLWRISAFDRLQADEVYLRERADRATLLPSTLLSELARLGAPHGDERGGDVLDVMAACMRHRESALLYLRRGEHVWPITLFPRDFLYHCPLDVLGYCGTTLSDFRVVSIEPAQVRPPGPLFDERVADAERYRPLLPLLWLFALHGPRAELLPGLGGAAAYRVSPAFDVGTLPLVGAIAPVFTQLRMRAMALRVMSREAGMDLQRAVRLLNALYLVSGLMVLRTHPAARDEPGAARRGLMARLLGGR